MCIPEITQPIGKDYEDKINRCNNCGLKTVIIGEEKGYHIRKCKFCDEMTAVRKNKQ